MSNIVAGHFQTQKEVAFAIGELEKIGFQREAISAFYANPAGQHDLYVDRGKSGEDARKTGMMVAVAAESLQQEKDALTLLEAIHAEEIECCVGSIVDGDWTDFDPLSAPHLRH
jgi:hypothetical protein